MKQKIGIALGSGASRGWSHIGVLKALIREGLEPDIVCGTSVGALIGAAYLSGNLERLEDWVRGSTQLDVARFFGIQLREAGFVDKERLRRFLHDYVAAGDSTIDDLPKPFAAVATDLGSGREYWLSKGPVVEAVRASMALPALFPTVAIDGRYLVDGGLVNPVPVSVCHALGADHVIAVNLNADIVGKHNGDNHARDDGNEDSEGVLDRWLDAVHWPRRDTEETHSEPAPGIFDVVANSINIFQDRITRSRLAGEPADVLIAPKLAHIGLLEFHRAGEAIKEGEKRTDRAMEDIRALFSRPSNRWESDDAD